MCIVLFSIEEHPLYRCILASNRDEFLLRPTEAAAWRDLDLRHSSDDQSGAILAGRDTLAGGTWLGMNKQGVIGILTNFTEPPPMTQGRLSRGALIQTCLDPSRTPREEIEALAPHAADFAAGFNLLALDLFPKTASSPEVYHLSNRGDRAGSVVKLETVIGGMSNSAISEPWAKVTGGAEHLRELLEEEKKVGPIGWTDDEWIERLRRVMRPSVPVEDPLQARAVFQRSTSINPIQLHFSQFVPITSTENDERWYGTRLVTVILVKHDGRFVFSEKDVWGLDDNGAPTKLDGERRFNGQLSLSGRMDVI